MFLPNVSFRRAATLAWLALAAGCAHSLEDVQALAQNPTPDAREELREVVFFDERAELRRAALKGFEKPSEDARTVLLLALIDIDHEVHEAAIELLAKGYEPASFFPMLQAEDVVKVFAGTGVVKQIAADESLKEVVHTRLKAFVKALGPQAESHWATDCRSLFKRLVARGPEVIELLKDLVEAQKGPIPATDVITALGDIGSARALSYLIKYVEGGQPELVSAALAAMSKIGGKETIVAIRDAVFQGKLDAAAQARAAAVIDAIQGLELERNVTRLGFDLTNVASVARAVLSEQLSEALPEVLSAYKAASAGRVRARLLEVVARADDPRAEALLKEALKDSDSKVRRVAALSMAGRPSQFANELTTFFREEGDKVVRAEVFQALRGFLLTAEDLTLLRELVASEDVTLSLEAASILIERGLLGEVQQVIDREAEKGMRTPLMDRMHEAFARARGGSPRALELLQMAAASEDGVRKESAREIMAKYAIAVTAGGATETEVAAPLPQEAGATTNVSAAMPEIPAEAAPAVPAELPPPPPYGKDVPERSKRVAQQAAALLDKGKFIPAQAQYKRAAKLAGSNPDITIQLGLADSYFDQADKLKKDLKKWQLAATEYSTVLAMAAALDAQAAAAAHKPWTEVESARKEAEKNLATALAALKVALADKKVPRRKAAANTVFALAKAKVPGARALLETAYQEEENKGVQKHIEKHLKKLGTP